MAEDYLTEMLTGQRGAIRTICKLVTCRACSSIPNSTLIMGLVVNDLNGDIPDNLKDNIFDNSLEYQMWEGEMILLPIRKYRGRGKGHEQFSGLRADQILCSRWGDPVTWHEKIFDLNPDKNKL